MPYPPAHTPETTARWVYNEVRQGHGNGRVDLESALSAWTTWRDEIKGPSKWQVASRVSYWNAALWHYDRIWDENHRVTPEGNPMMYVRKNTLAKLLIVYIGICTLLALAHWAS